MFSNSSHMDYTTRGILDTLPMEIYVNDNSVAKIISLKEVADSFRMNIDTKEDHSKLFH